MYDLKTRMEGDFPTDMYISEERDIEIMKMIFSSLKEEENIVEALRKKALDMKDPNELAYLSLMIGKVSQLKAFGLPMEMIQEIVMDRKTSREGKREVERLSIEEKNLINQIVEDSLKEKQ